MDKRSFFVLTGQILLACAIVASTIIVTKTIRLIKLGHGSIHVKGCAEKEIQSDFVSWGLSIKTTAETQIIAYDKLEKDMEILSTYLQKQGIIPKETDYSPIYTSINYKINEQGITTNVIESYTLRQEFEISSKEIELIAKVSQSITSLIKDEVMISSFAPRYYYLKIDELKIAMLAEASKDSKKRAEALVNKSGSKVIGLKNAQQGVFQITPAFSSSISDYGEYDTTSIAKRIKAVITMEYMID